MDQRIPEQYRKLWEPYNTKSILYHLTSVDSLEQIVSRGLEPRDPYPNHWAGMKAIFMALPDDSLFKETQKYVAKHVAEKGKDLVRLHIKTQNGLFRSTDPRRTFQVISLEQIAPAEIIKIEYFD